MVRTGFATAVASALFIVAMGSAANAAEPAEPAASASKPLDLSLPREAGQWTGMASRVQPQAARAARDATASLQGQGSRERAQPYGTGYEARMSTRDGGVGAMVGAAGGGGGGSGGAASPAPRGGGRGR